MDGVANFKYLGRPLDQTGNDWPVVRLTFRWAHRVWGRLGKLLLREGEETKVAAMFYREVTQAVLIFVLET